MAAEVSSSPWMMSKEKKSLPLQMVRLTQFRGGAERRQVDLRLSATPCPLSPKNSHSPSVQRKLP